MASAGAAAVKITVVGAGAMGGLLAARLALAGEAVRVIDRGAHLAAIRKNGLKLVGADEREAVAGNLEASDGFKDAAPQDLVVLAVKAHYLDAVAADVPRLVGPETTILTVQNGIPWWYFHRHGGPYDGLHLRSLDPTGKLTRHIDSQRIVGCVAYPAALVPEAGVIKHVEGDRVLLGELDGAPTARVEALRQALLRAGFQARVLADIRSEIWLKAWGNLAFNPISALTHATLEAICRLPETRRLAAGMMSEAQEIARGLGISFRDSIEKRLEGAERVGALKTSMLQDLELGRSLEIEALAGAVLELAQITETPAPAIAAVYACVKLLNRTLILEGAGLTASDAA